MSNGTERISSPNGKYYAQLQDDGNFVVRDYLDRPIGWTGADPTPPPPLPPPQPPPPIVTLPELRTINGVFEQVGGTRFTVIMSSEFNLLNRWQHGEDVTSLLAQRKAAGFNFLRVWTLFDIPSIGKFLDIDYGRVPAFIDLCASYGLYVEFTAYTSTEWPNHWAGLVGACGQRHNRVLLELVNEGDLSVNHIDMARYDCPDDVIASHGSAGSETEPPWKCWDYCGWHTNGANQEQRKVGKQPYSYWREFVNVPVICNETSRYPDVGMWVGSDVSRCIQLAYDSARGAALLAAGSCFHSVAGKTSVLWDSTANAVASAWAEGARSMPLAAQHQPYNHRIDLETPGIIRAYQRGSDDAHIALIRE